MSTFFRQTAQAMIAKHIDRFPLLKLDQVIDWQPIEQYLKKGSQVYIEGRIQSRKYTGKDGIERTAYDIIGSEMKMLGGRQSSGSSAPYDEGYQPAPQQQYQQQPYQAQQQPAYNSEPPAAPRRQAPAAPAQPVDDIDDDIPF